MAQSEVLTREVKAKWLLVTNLLFQSQITQRFDESLGVFKWMCAVVHRAVMRMKQREKKKTGGKKTEKRRKKDKKKKKTCDNVGDI